MLIKKIKNAFKRKVLGIVRSEWSGLITLKSIVQNSNIGKNVNIIPAYRIIDCDIGSYTYIAESSIISKTKIGKFCSIGPNFISGWGIHPTNMLSTSPMFYSTLKQNGMTLSDVDKIQERKKIIIGNDVFIGMNVSILDGVTVGDGAIIGAGAVVSKDIPPYAIAVGCPIKIIQYRFTSEQIEKFMRIQWWNWSDQKLKEVEKYFLNVEDFLIRYS